MIYMENSHVRDIFRNVPDDVVRNFIRLPRVYPATTTTKATTVTDATAVKIFQQWINNEFWKKFTHDIKRKVTNLAIQWRRVGLKTNCQDVDRKNVVICSTYWNQDFTLQALWDKKIPESYQISPLTPPKRCTVEDDIFLPCTTSAPALY